MRIIEIRPSKKFGGKLARVRGARSRAGLRRTKSTRSATDADDRCCELERDPPRHRRQFSRANRQSGRQFRSFLADYVQYGDLWYRRKDAAIEAGLFPHGYVDPATLLQIASDDLTEEPGIRSPSNMSPNTAPSSPSCHPPARSQSSVRALPRSAKAISSISTVASTALAFVYKVLGKDRASDKDGTVKLTVENHRANWPVLYVQPPAPKDPDFNVYASRWFKLQGYTIGPVFPLADCAVIPHVFFGGAVSVPNSITLVPTFTVTADGVLNSAVTASWIVPGDQDIASFNARYRTTAETLWIVRNVGGDPSAVFNFLQPNKGYFFSFQSVTADGETSDWSTPAVVTTATSGVLAAPTFINDYTAGALSNISYDDLFALSVRVQTATGMKVRYSLNKAVTPTSPFWPAFSGGGDGTGTNMIGFVQSTGAGPDAGPFKHTTIWHVCEVDPAQPLLLGPETAITTTYVPVDMTGWPQVPAPYVYVDAGDNSGVARGQNGYKVRADCVDASATIYHSSDGASWSVYTAGTQVTMNAGLNHYWQAKRYITPQVMRVILHKCIALRGGFATRLQCRRGAFAKGRL